MKKPKKQRKFFQTWQEASKVCIKAGVEIRDDYRSRYGRIDSRLPGSPRQCYEDFPGWPIFLGKRKGPIYSTWQQASRICVKAGIKTYRV